MFVTEAGLRLSNKSLSGDRLYTLKQVRISTSHFGTQHCNTIASSLVPRGDAVVLPIPRGDAVVLPTLLGLIHAAPARVSTPPSTCPQDTREQVAPRQKRYTHVHTIGRCGGFLSSCTRTRFGYSISSMKSLSRICTSNFIIECKVGPQIAIFCGLRSDFWVPFRILFRR